MCHQINIYLFDHESVIIFTGFWSLPKATHEIADTAPNRVNVLFFCDIIFSSPVCVLWLFFYCAHLFGCSLSLSQNENSHPLAKMCATNKNCSRIYIRSICFFVFYDILRIAFLMQRNFIVSFFNLIVSFFVCSWDFSHIIRWCQDNSSQLVQFQSIRYSFIGRTSDRNCGVLAPIWFCTPGKCLPSIFFLTNRSIKRNTFFHTTLIDGVSCILHVHKFSLRRLFFFCRSFSAPVRRRRSVSHHN